MAWRRRADAADDGSAGSAGCRENDNSVITVRRDFLDDL